MVSVNRLSKKGTPGRKEIYYISKLAIYFNSKFDKTIRFIFERSFHILRVEALLVVLRNFNIKLDQSLLMTFS